MRHKPYFLRNPGSNVMADAYRNDPYYAQEQARQANAEGAVGLIPTMAQYDYRQILTHNEQIIQDLSREEWERLVYMHDTAQLWGIDQFEETDTVYPVRNQIGYRTPPLNAVGFHEGNLGI